MDPKAEGQSPSSSSTEPEVFFQSSDISKTKSAKPSEYFVKIKDSPASRRKRAESRRAQRRAKCAALKARHHAKALSRHQYLIAWLRIYRGPIAIIFLSATAIVIILGIIIVITWPKPKEYQFPSYSPEEFQDVLSEFVSSPDTPNAPAPAEELLELCAHQIATTSDPEDLSNVYLSCASQISLTYASLKADLILEYAYKAEELTPSLVTAQTIVEYEEAYGSPEKAQEYRDIVQERMRSFTDPSPEDYEKYRAEMIEYFENGGGV